MWALVRNRGYQLIFPGWQQFICLTALLAYLDVADLHDLDLRTHGESTW